jgi:isopentenyldiphosphate isomerase
MKVRVSKFSPLFAYHVPDSANWPLFCSVDYILFLTADVTVNANANEIRDHKYVDKAELQAMFEDEGMQKKKAEIARALAKC